MTCTCCDVRTAASVTGAECPRCGHLPREHGVSMNEYTFDVVAVVTFHVSAADYPTARRAVESVDEYHVQTGEAEGCQEPGVSFTLTAVDPRGRASLADTDSDEAIPADDYQTFTEPLLDVRDDLRAMLDEADKALGGDSNDAEHDALYSLREIIAGLLGDDSDAPSPADS